MQYGFRILLLVVAMLGSGARTFGQTAEQQTQLAAARRKWSSTQSKDYRFTFRWICFCRFRGPVGVTVRAGKIETIKSLADSDGGTIPRDQFNDYKTVEQLFDLIAQAMEKKAESIKATYDTERGYPRSAYIDYHKMIADEEIGFEIKDFQPLSSAANTSAHQPSQSQVSTNVFTVKAPSGATIWIDGLRYGATGTNGELAIKMLQPGTHTLRARLKGKHEIEQRFTSGPAAPTSTQVNLTLPADKAELSFQTAEELREAGKHNDAIKTYREALKLRATGMTAARLGLARSLVVPDEYDAAIAEVRHAMKERPGPFPEAHTVLGNIRRSQGFADEALTSYRTAIAQSKGTAPEPYTGIALVYQDRNRPDEAIKSFQFAARAAGDTEPVIYFLLGSALERENRMKEAVAAYDKYLQLDPNGAQAAAVRSVVKQLRREIR